MDDRFKLSKTLGSARAKARELASLRPAPGTERAALHAHAFLRDHLPPLEKLQRALLHFLGEALPEAQKLERWAAGRNSPNPAFAARTATTFDRFHQQAVALKTALQEALQRLSELRGLIAGDAGQMERDLDGVRQEAQRLIGDIAEKDKRVSTATLRVNFTSFIPLAKVIDEIVSLAQDGSFTEETLARAVEDLDAARKREKTLRERHLAVTVALSGGNELIGNLQALANATAILGGDLANVRDDLRALGDTPPACLLLRLAALRAGLATLEAEAA